MINLRIFDLWNISKKEIETRLMPEFYINDREIWFTKLGKNIGYEEDGKNKFLRPVIVIKKIGSLFLILPLTSRGKNSRFYYKFNEIYLHNPRYKDSSYAILSQIKVMDKRRFIENVGKISEKEFLILKQKLKTLLF